MKGYGVDTYDPGVGDERVARGPVRANRIDSLREEYQDSMIEIRKRLDEIERALFVQGVMRGPEGKPWGG